MHGIAGGPDGRCALCHAAARTDAERSASKLGLRLILGLSSAGVALLAYGAWRRPTVERQASAPRVTRESTTTVAAATAVAPPIAADPPPARPFADAPTPPPAPPAPALLTEATSATAIATASANQAPAPVATARPSPEQVNAAVAATPITMFTAPWCAVCRRAHAFLQENGLRCVDRDIESDVAARRELRQRTGRTAIPTFVVDGQLLEPGFSERRVERAVAQSVERRLGVTGLSIQRGSAR